MGAGDSFLAGFVLTYYNGKKVFDFLSGNNAELFGNAEDQEDYFSHLIEYSMCVANVRAIKSCMTKGAFGFGVQMP